MRNAIITLVAIVVIISSSFYLVISQEAKPEDLMKIFLEQLLTATPETYDEIFHINIFDQLEVDTYTIHTYSPIATDRLMLNIVANRIIGYSSEVAFRTNSNVTLDSLEITLTQTSDEKIYFDFKGTTRVTSIETLEIVDYPIVGQIGIKDVDGTYKVDTLKFYTIDLLDHLRDRIYENRN